MTGAAEAPWIAPGRARVCTFLVCREPEAVIDFATAVFGATLRDPPLYRSDGALWNAELELDGATVMIGEAQEGFERPGFVYVYVPDAEATFAAALDAGGTPIMAPETQFYGAVDGGVEDPGGNWWWIGTHRETLARDEIERRARATEAERAAAEGDPR